MLIVKTRGAQKKRYKENTKGKMQTNREWQSLRVKTFSEIK